MECKRLHDVNEKLGQNININLIHFSLYFKILLNEQAQSQKSTLSKPKLRYATLESLYKIFYFQTFWDDPF